MRLEIPGMGDNGVAWSRGEAIKLLAACPVCHTECVDPWHTLMMDNPPSPLSEDMLAIIRLYAHGLTAQEVAERTGRNMDELRKTRQYIRFRLNVPTWEMVMVEGMRKGLIQ